MGGYGRRCFDQFLTWEYAGAGKDRKTPGWKPQGEGCQQECGRFRPLEYRGFTKNWDLSLVVMGNFWRII